MVEVEDFVNASGMISIQRNYNKTKAEPRESGLLSWLGLGNSVTDFSTPRRPTAEQEQLRNVALSVIAECHPEQIVTDAKYLTSSALVELINSIVHASTNIYLSIQNNNSNSSTNTPESREEQIKKLNDMVIIYFNKVML